MTKRLFFVLGVLVGCLLTEVMRRKQMERLQSLETQAAKRKARLAQYEREWQEELATLPFEERMQYELWEASMRLDNWRPAAADDDATTN